MPGTLQKAIPYFKKLAQALIRMGRPVSLLDLKRVEPIGYSFGADRGKAIDRYYIDRFLSRKHELITGVTLEIADSSYSRRFGQGVQKHEVLHAVPGNPEATIVGDLSKPETLPEGVADCFICTQTFSVIFEIEAAIRGARRLIKPGGVLLGTVSGIAQVSKFDMDRWGDYWRFTDRCVRRLLEPVFSGGVEVETFGNALAATAFIQCLSLEDIPDHELLDRKDPDYPCVIGFVAKV